MKNAQRSAVFISGANFFGERDFGFALQDRERSAEFVGRVRDEAALAFECGVETVEKAVEGSGEAAEFIVRILNGKTIVNGELADVIGLRGHIGDRSETFAREEIASRRGEDDGEGNQPPESDANIFEERAFETERGENHQLVGISRSGKGSRVAASAAVLTSKRAEGFGWSRE